MSVSYFEITLKPGVRRRAMGSNPGPVKALNGGKMILKLNSDKTWEMASPFNPEWRYYIPDYPAGKWEETAISYELSGQNGDICFRIYDIKKADGSVHYGDAGGQQVSISTWKRIARPLPMKGTGCWSGLALKGSAGLIVEGEEVLCIVRSFDNVDKGAWFNMLSARLGLVGGFSAGVAFVLVTGFPDINVLHNFPVIGWDWTLSIGAKWGALAKMGTTGPKLLKIIQGINRMEDLIKAMKAAKNDKEIVGMGKAMYDNWGYDFEEPKVTVVDIPLAGAGVEAGIYGYAGTCKLFRSW